MRSLKSIQNEIESLGEVDLFGTSKEVSHLPEILQDDEHIKYLTSGMMDGTTWLIVCTQKRIILVDYGMFFWRKTIRNGFGECEFSFVSDRLDFWLN